MNTIQCHHRGAEAKGQMCHHLLARLAPLSDSASRDHHRLFTGKGSEYVLLCGQCAIAPEPMQWLRVCADCFEGIAMGGKRLGVQGSPEVRQRDAGLSLVHQPARFSQSTGKLLAVAPTGQDWLAINERRELLLFQTENLVFRRLLRLEQLSLPLDPPFHLVSAPGSPLVLIASAYGRHGVVVDLSSGKATMRLDRGDYQIKHCRFSAAFFECEGRLLLVHGTDWNRLDVSDPSSGQLLTPRQPRPEEHSLDYFHCGLSISPDGQWIAGNGWIWHPMGEVVSWSLRQWLENNVWESEDGDSKRQLCQREYYWDGPLCWLDSSRLAVWGHGEDEALMLPGIRIFDVGSGQELPGFTGPMVGAEFADNSSGTLVFDEYLFSYDHGCDFAVWDVTTGERLLRDDTFLPLAYHPTAKVFLSQDLDGAIQSTQLITGQPDYSTILE